MVNYTCFWALLEQNSLNIVAFQILYRRTTIRWSLLDLVQKGQNSLNITAFNILYRRTTIRWILQPFRSCTEGRQFAEAFNILYRRTTIRWILQPLIFFTEGRQFAEYYSLSDLAQKSHNSLNIIALYIMYRRAEHSSFVHHIFPWVNVLEK